MMVLTYSACEETVDNNKQERDNAIATLSDQVIKLMAEVQDLKRKNENISIEKRPISA